MTRLLATVMLFTWAAPGLAGAAFPDFGYTPPADWSGPVFQLSQDYPTTLPAAETVPWKTIDFKTDPQGYLQAVIDYCLEGNEAVDFVVQDNAVRTWYHAPWLHWGGNGREFVRGLTRERSSRPFELAATQTTTLRNVAVGFYNARGAFTIGQVWADPDAPAVDHVEFPEDTVTFKLLFTAGTAAVVPFLTGAPEWFADINRSPDSATIQNTKVRLLQVDIAIRDNRSSCAGWVFGTFQYDSAVAAASPWRQLRPLTLMWGNDPGLTPAAHAGGQEPVESWVNPAAPVVQYRRSPPAGVTPPRVMGWAGRGNGPVDNPVSSCLSCHSTAQIPASSGMIPAGTLTDMQKLRWFRNLAVGESFDTTSKTLDFSLQLGVGIQNHREFLETVENLGGITAASLRAPKPFLLPTEVPSADWKGKRSQEYRFSRDPDDPMLSQPQVLERR